MLRALVCVIVVLTAAGPVRAEERVKPSWMTVDAGAKQVAIDVLAGFNANNSSWNFNGYYGGDATVVVPAGWDVRITLTNRDGDVPHSLVVIDAPASPDDLPLQAGREQVAIPRAYSKSPEQGISAGDEDVVAFKTKQAGDYLWFCGVPGHGQSGMWIYFEVAADADAPYLTLAEGAEAGRE
ncbi:MAG TPA: sulfocyanin-like copper-binding protein [Geminicoccaceae bacterium]|nr:sulfocyanin-like copper-binding protein [Geminicoccaceae bacterium]